MSLKAQEPILNRRDRRKRGFTRKAIMVAITSGLVLGAGFTAGGVMVPVTAAQAVSLGAGVWFGGDVGAGSFLHANGTIVYCAELGKATVMGNNPAMGATSALPAYNSQSYMVAGQTFNNVGTGELSGDGLRYFNYVLSHYGATGDNAQAGAVQIALWKLRAGSGTPGYQQALAFMEAGVGPSVVAFADAMINEAVNATGAATAPADPMITPGLTPYQGTVRVEAGTTELTITNGLFASTGTNRIEFPGGLTAATDVPFIGQAPADLDSWDRHYRVTINGKYTYTVEAAAVLYGSPGGLGQGLVTSPAPEVRTGDFEAVYIDPDTIWSPVLSTKVESFYLEAGDRPGDNVTFSVAEGSNPWRQAIAADGSTLYAPIHATGTLYGPFLANPAETPSATPPANAPVASTGEITTDTKKGPGTYKTQMDKVVEPGFYTFVWNIDFADQLRSVQAPKTGTPSLPVGYFFTDGFGQADESVVVPTELGLSTQLKDNDITLDELTLQDVVTSKLLNGGWLQQDGQRAPVTVRLTAYGQTGEVVQAPAAPVDAKEIARTTVVLNAPKTEVESAEMKISLEDFKAYDGGAVQACILNEGQPENSRGLFVETCDEYGVASESFVFTKPSVTTKAQTTAVIEGTASDTAILKDSDLPEGSTIGATAYLVPQVGDYKYDGDWEPVLDENGEPTKWTEEDLAGLSPEALCEVQPVFISDRVPAKEQGEYELPAVTVKSDGTGINWVEDTIIPHPETGEPVEWSRGKCGVVEEYTDIPKPEISTKVHLAKAFPTDINWDNLFVKNLEQPQDSKFKYEAIVDAFYTKDEKAVPTCDVDDKVWTSKKVTITKSGEYKTNEYLISDVLPEGATEGRLDHVEKLIRIDKETGEKEILDTGKCGEVSESTIIQKPGIPPVVERVLATTGENGTLPLIAGSAAALLLGGAALATVAIRRRKLATANTPVDTNTID